MRMLLGTLCILALVIVGSAIRRMSTYEQAYGFTRLRVFVQGWSSGSEQCSPLCSSRGSGCRGVVATSRSSEHGRGDADTCAINPDAYIARHERARYEDRSDRYCVPGNTVRRCFRHWIGCR